MLKDLTKGGYYLYSAAIFLFTLAISLFLIFYTNIVLDIFRIPKTSSSIPLYYQGVLQLVTVLFGCYLLLEALESFSGMAMEINTQAKLSVMISFRASLNEFLSRQWPKIVHSTLEAALGLFVLLLRGASYS